MVSLSIINTKQCMLDSLFSHTVHCTVGSAHGCAVARDDAKSDRNALE